MLRDVLICARDAEIIVSIAWRKIKMAVWTINTSKITE